MNSQPPTFLPSNSLTVRILKCWELCKHAEFHTILWIKPILCYKEEVKNSIPLGFPCGSAGKESTCNVGDLGSIPGLGRFPGEGKGYPLQYSCLENSMDCVVYGVAKSWTQLSDLHFTLNRTLIIFDKQSVQTWIDMSHNNEFNNDFMLITFYFHLLKKLFYFITGWLS